MFSFGVTIVGIQAIQNRQRLFHVPSRRHGPEVIFGIPCRQSASAQLFDQFVGAEATAARQQLQALYAVSSGNLIVNVVIAIPPDIGRVSGPAVGQKAILPDPIRTL